MKLYSVQLVFPKQKGQRSLRLGNYHVMAETEDQAKAKTTRYVITNLGLPAPIRAIAVELEDGVAHHADGSVSAASYLLRDEYKS